MPCSTLFERQASMRAKWRSIMGQNKQLKCMHTKYKGTNGEEGAASLERAAFFTPDE
jgi:hypothetical protein